MRNKNTIWVIEYDGRISKEGYNTLDLALEHLKKQGYYYQDLGLVFYDACNNMAKVYDI